MEDEKHSDFPAQHINKESVPRVQARGNNLTNSTKHFLHISHC